MTDVLNEVKRTIREFDLLKKAENQARCTSERYFENEYKTSNERLTREVAMQLQNLMQSYESEKHQLDEKTRRTVNPNEKKALQKEFERINKEIEDRKSKLPNGEKLVFAPRLLMMALIRRI